MLPFWEIIESARGYDAVAVHIAPGHGPMMRLAARELLPIPDPFDAPSADDITVFLSGIIEPERWRHLEDMGNGEVRAVEPVTGENVMVALLKSVNGWVIVAKL